MDLLKAHNLKPEEVVFIDDQKENITAAKEYGIEHSILYDDIYTVKEKLFDLGLLSEKPVRPSIPWNKMAVGSTALLAGYMFFSNN